MILNNQDEIKNLSLNSHVIINTKCDVCQKIGETSYGNYNRNTKIQTEPYCCSNKCAYVSGKNKKTCIKKYGVENPFQSEQIREKAKKTCLEKYGAENAQQNKDIKDKTKNTNIKKYGGNSPSCSTNIKEKQRKAKLEKYNDENYNNREQARKTNLEKYNCEFPMQNYELHEKQQLSGKKLKLHQETGLYYRGSYEKDFLDYCFANKIKIEKAPPIKYKFKNKNKIYYPDSYLKEKNLIIEIKSIYTYKKYLDKNLAKKNACKKQGYNYIFIIDKNYEKFKNIIK